MDIILETARKFASKSFKDVREYKSILNEVKETLVEIDSKRDKIKYLTTLLEANKIAYEEHKPKCEKPDNCVQNFGFESITYYLGQELTRLGLKFNDDAFTISEVEKIEVNFEQIFRDLSELKLGQEIIYDDLVRELNELRELYYLGKKNWIQLLVGKSIEMVANQIISETISKQIISDIKSHFKILSIGA